MMNLSVFSALPIYSVHIYHKILPITCKVQRAKGLRSIIVIMSFQFETHPSQALSRMLVF